METFEVTDDDRRAIRFVRDGRKTMCNRAEARDFILGAVNTALRDLRYRWHGPSASAAVLAGADPKQYEQSGELQPA
jgi:hypothetical protein